MFWRAQHQRIDLEIKHTRWCIIHKYIFYCHLPHTTHYIWRRVLKIAKNDYWLRHGCPPGTIRLPLNGFSWNMIWVFFFSENNQVSLKSDKNNGHFTWRPIYVGYSESKYRLRIFETVTLRMCSDFLYQLRSHRRHFVKFVLCLCLFLCVKRV